MDTLPPPALSSLPTVPSSTPLAWRITLPVLVLVVFAVPLTIPYPLVDPAEGFACVDFSGNGGVGRLEPPAFARRGFPRQTDPFLLVPGAASLKLLGMNESAARLPGLLFGAFGVLTTVLVGARLFNRATGILAGMLYATLVLPAVMAQSGAHDIALIPWVNVAVLLYWEMEQEPGLRRQWWRLLLVGVALGIGCLTKGLVGIAVVGTVYGTYVIASGAWKRLGIVRLGLTAGITLGVTAIIAAPWYLLMEAYRPGYLWYFFIDRHVYGFATDTQMHSNQPWWYYLPVILVGGLPWIGYLPHVIQEAWHTRKERGAPQDRSAHTLLWCWLIVTLLLFTAAKSKTAAYILPVFPPIAVLCASVWTRLLDGRLSESTRKGLARTFWLSLPTAAAPLPVLLIVVQKAFDCRFGPAVWILAVAIALTPAVMVFLWTRRRFAGVLAVGTLFTCAELLFALVFLAPQFTPRFSAKELAGEFNRRGRVPRQVLLGDEHLGSIVFYLEPELRANLHPGPNPQDLPATRTGRLGRRPRRRSRRLQTPPRRRPGADPAGEHAVGGVRETPAVGVRSVVRRDGKWAGGREVLRGAVRGVPRAEKRTSAREIKRASHKGTKTRRSSWLFDVVSSGPVEISVSGEQGTLFACLVGHAIFV